MHRRAFVVTGIASLAGLRERLPNALRRAADARFSTAYPVGHVRRYGAKGDGIADDTDAFARATRAIGERGSGRIIVDDGIFLIDANVDEGRGIKLPSNSTLVMAKGATLRAKPNALTRYGVVNLKHVTNVHVIGGRIEGERATHGGTTGEWGMGIWMNSASHCSVRDTVIADCWGDGVYVGSTEPRAGMECSDILLDHIWCDNNRRQGASIVSAKRVRIVNSRFSRTSGTAPAAGVDFEPDPGSAVVEDCLVQDCIFENNLIGVLLIGPSRRMNIVRNQFDGNKAYGVHVVHDVQEAVIDRNSLSQRDSTTTAIRLEYVRGARVVGNTVRGSFRHGVMEQGAGGNHIADNLLVP